MRGPLIGVLAGVVLCAAAVVYLSGPRELTIVVVSLDTTRPDHMSAYGYPRPTTPVLARLAREGTVFSEARSTTSWTLPSHMSLFTGQPAAVHDVLIDFHELDRSRPTVGELFHDAGYRTAGFYSAPYVHGHFGFDRGMDFYESATLDPPMYDLPPETIRAQLGAREQMSHHEVTSERVVDQAIGFLKGRRRPRNLLFLHFFDPHYDFLAPPRFERAFTDPAYAGPIDGHDVTAVNLPDAPPLSPADRAQLEGLYDAELAWVDAQLGRLVAFLEDSGLRDEVLLVVTGDHGEEFFERGRFGHRAGLHDEVLRVPLIVWGPGLGVPAGRVVDDPVALYDVLPTLLDYAGLERDRRVYGRSLRPLIEGDGLPPRPVFAELTFIPLQHDGAYTRHEAIVFQGMKAIRQVDRTWSPQDQRDLDGAPIAGSERFFVYDLVADPGERTNLVGSDDPRVDDLLAELARERARQRDAHAAFRPLGGTPGASPDLTLQEHLAATGYLQR